MNTEEENKVFDRFVALGAEVKSETCDHTKQPCDCYNNCRQAQLTYQGELVTFLQTRDGIHVSFGKLEEFPPDASELSKVENLVSIMEDGR